MSKAEYQIRVGALGQDSVFHGPYATAAEALREAASLALGAWKAEGFPNEPEPRTVVVVTRHYWEEPDAEGEGGWGTENEIAWWHDNRPL